MFRRPNAIARGAFWGAMQAMGRAAQRDETQPQAGAGHADAS